MVGKFWTKPCQYQSSIQVNSKVTEMVWSYWTNFVPKTIICPISTDFIQSCKKYESLKFLTQNRGDDGNCRADYHTMVTVRVLPVIHQSKLKINSNVIDLQKCKYSRKKIQDIWAVTPWPAKRVLYVYANSTGSGEAAQICRFTWAFTVTKSIIQAPKKPQKVSLRSWFNETLSMPVCGAKIE